MAFYALTSIDRLNDFEPLAIVPALALVDDLVQRARTVTQTRYCQYVSKMAKRRFGWQRLLIKHVNGGARNLLLLQRFDQCRFTDSWP